MLRLPSLQNRYDEYWEGDPAFVQPPAPAADSATPDERKATDKLIADHARRVELARDTGDWRALLAGDEVPFKFVLRPLRGETYRKICDDAVYGRIGPAEHAALLVRCALVEFDGEPIKSLEAHPRYGKIAPAEFTDRLDALDTRIVRDLATAIEKRARGVPPHR